MVKKCAILSRKLGEERKILKKAGKSASLKNAEAL